MLQVCHKIEAKPLEDILPTLKKTLDTLYNDHIHSFQNHTINKAPLFKGEKWENWASIDGQKLESLELIQNCVYGLL